MLVTSSAIAAICSRFEHLVARDAVQGGHEVERLAFEGGRPVGHVGAGPVSRMDDAHGGQRA
jgi:hypothetical protein